MTAVQQAARDAVKAGLSIVPPAEDGTKRPAPNWPPDAQGRVGAWKCYTSDRAGSDTLQRWYGPRTGLGVICGQVSGNLECLEFDDRLVYEQFVDLARQAEMGDVIDRLESGYTEDSPAGGVHWLYRCADIAGNLKLATRAKQPGEQLDAADTVKTLIETRGEKGFCILAPSNGRVHPSGGAYRLRAGGFATIPTLTPQERRDLHQLAGAFHEPDQAERRRDEPNEPAAASGGRPGDDFVRRSTWGDVLMPHGWREVFTHGDTTHWRRPGKDHGTSATTNYGGTDYLIVFSSSTPFDRKRAYNRFTVHAILNHGGDFAAAARDLAAKGYGEPAARPGPSPAADAADAPTPHQAVPWARPLPDLIAHLADRPDEPPLIGDFILANVITLLHGQPRDWKTLVALHAAIAVATGRPLFGLSRLAVPVPRNVLYLTEEDGARRVTDRLRLICAGLECAPPANLFVAAGTGFSLDDPDAQARLIAFVRAHDIALVIADPLRSLSACVDQGPRELRPLTLTLRSLMRETGCALFAVHHDSKPLAMGADTRRRPQRASGGGVFSIADSPIGIDTLPDGRRLLTPTAWKFSEDPPAVVLAIESGPDWIRLVGQDADGATSASEADLAGRIVAFLAANPKSSGTAVQKATKVRKELVLKVLQQLAESDKVASVKKGKAKLWSVCDEGTREPCGNHRNEPDSEAEPVGSGSGTTPQDPQNTARTVVPEVGNHAEPHQQAVPDNGEFPVYGSGSYKGTIPGNHATREPEPMADAAPAEPLEVPVW